MDQDIRLQHSTAFASGAVSTYLEVPYRCTLRNVVGIVQADPGDAETITIFGGGTVAAGAAGATTTLGVLTFGSDIAPGAKGTWAPDSTNGSMTLLAGSMLKITTSAAAAAAVHLDVELDPYARK